MQDIKNQQMTVQQAMQRASQLLESDDLPKAEVIYKQIIKTNPKFDPAFFQLGVIASKVGKLLLAADLIAKAVEIDSAKPDYHRALGELYRRLGRHKLAIAHGWQAKHLAPEDAQTNYNLALALADGGKLDEAAETYRTVLKLKPDYGFAANNLGTVLERLGDEDGAIESYRKAIEINPKHAEAQNNLGAILSARGELGEARGCFEAAIKANNNFVHSHYNLSTLKKYTEDDPHLKSLESLVNQADKMPPETKMKLWFALGKAREDTKQYDEAFAAYKQGNDLKRASFKYDEKRTQKIMDDIMERFDRNLVKKKAKGCEDETPIFIVGMPRSGTTLIEQILSSHPKVHGAGELSDFSDALSEMHNAQPGSSYIDWLLEAGGEDLQNLGKSYIEKLKSHSSNAARISDKMPANFFYVGLIHTALPNAKIIYSKRNPMDTCLSNYARLFNETMPFAYDLKELGHYQNYCDKMMKHWKKALPKNTILEVKYEDVVANLEKQSKRLIKFCDLDWDENCLAFHKNKRQVKTASIAQVRKPIYKTSVARWENFKEHLKPLQNAIEGED